MDPHPVRSGLQRLGDTITNYDPSNPANVGRVAPIAAGAASAMLPLVAPEAAIPVKMGLAALGGGVAPYAEYAASKATGGNPELPDWKDAAHSAILNSLFEGAATGSTTLGAAERNTAAETTRMAKQVAPEMSRLPPELQTPENIRAAVKNRDFLKKFGMGDPEIDAALKDPAGTAERLQRSVDQGRKVVSHFNEVTMAERGRFTKLYNTALGDQATATTQAAPIAEQMRTIAQDPSEHELTPSFKSWLNRKANELDPPASGIKDPSVKTDLGRKLDPSNPAEKRLMDAMQAAGLAGAPPKASVLTVQGLRDLYTELGENIPAGATNLDKKAAHDLQTSLTELRDKTMLDNGATHAQVEMLKGVDADYGLFQNTIRGLRPGSKEFGEQAAQAFFDTAKQNPTLALNFVRMAEDAGKLPEFREQFLDKIVGDIQGAKGASGAPGTPINQMEVLRKLQTDWRTTKDGEQVLKSVFGKDSPMADPVTFSKVMGAADNPAAAENAKNSVAKFIRSPRTIANLAIFYGTYATMTGLMGGKPSSPWSDLRNNPERAMAALAMTMLTHGAINRVMAHVEPATARAYANWVTNRDPEAFVKLIRMSGQTATALSSQPTPTP